jgi:hypothetical protein
MFDGDSLIILSLQGMIQGMMGRFGSAAASLHAMDWSGSELRSLLLLCI